MVRRKPGTFPRPRLAPQRGGLKLPPAWEPVNQRRVQLLRKRRTGASLSLAEETELRELQDLSRRYLDAVAPISLEAIEDLRNAVKEAEKGGGRSRTKAS